MKSIHTQTLTDAANAIKLHFSNTENKTYNEMACSSIGGIMIGETKSFSDRYQSGKHQSLINWAEKIEIELNNRLFS